MEEKELKEATEQRIRSRVAITASDCWEWLGHVQASGYGIMSYRGRTCRAHRVSYITFTGDIPEGYDIDHLCRNRKCVNPKHLEAVTKGDNVRRGFAARLSGFYCRRGHPKIAGNVKMSSRGPTCKTCEDKYLSKWRVNTKKELDLTRNELAEANAKLLHLAEENESLRERIEQVAAEAATTETCRLCGWDVDAHICGTACSEGPDPRDAKIEELEGKLREAHDAILYFKLHETDQYRGKALRRLWAVLSGTPQALREDDG